MPTAHRVTDQDVYARRMAVGTAVREARAHAGLSQAELGDRISRDHKTISRWENAATDIRLSDVVRLEAALELPAGELLRRAALASTRQSSA